jgi:hypothetical protein
VRAQAADINDLTIRASRRRLATLCHPSAADTNRWRILGYLLKGPVIWRGDVLVFDNFGEMVRRAGLVEDGFALPDARDCLSECGGLSDGC